MLLHLTNKLALELLTTVNLRCKEALECKRAPELIKVTRVPLINNRLLTKINALNSPYNTLSAVVAVNPRNQNLK